MAQPSGRGPMVEYLERMHGVAERRACRVLCVQRATYRYRSCLDFVVDQLQSGTRFRSLTIVDTYRREAVAIEVGQSLKGDDVVAR